MSAAHSWPGARQIPPLPFMDILRKGLKKRDKALPARGKRIWLILFSARLPAKSREIAHGARHVLANQKQGLAKSHVSR